jgi:hypothetical protein
VSGSVVATWIVRKEPTGSPGLQLLVLWRGTPGWCLRDDSSGSSGRTSSRGDGKDRGLVVQKVSYGGIGLAVEFDGNKRMARIQGNELNLGTDNVILVDGVDDAAELRIVKTLEVDGRLPHEAAVVESIIRRNPDLYAYLRCNARLPNSPEQSMIDAICARMKPK